MRRTRMASLCISSPSTETLPNLHWAAIPAWKPISSAKTDSSLGRWPCTTIVRLLVAFQNEATRDPLFSRGKATGWPSCTQECHEVAIVTSRMGHPSGGSLSRFLLSIHTQSSAESLLEIRIHHKWWLVDRDPVRDASSMLYSIECL